ncbi:MAG: type II toxin-antitoxin system HicA family toxin [Deltaproteobacteria bacterium]|nr:type II toxin-antitoxin system HicA family toxin [Deltaproteobacteria bacterium]
MTDEICPLIERLRRRPQNVPFRALEALLARLAYELDRQRGSHMIFKCPQGGPRISIQRQGALAKPYQVRQVLRVAEIIVEEEP